MFLPSQMQIPLWTLAALLAANIFIMALFVLYTKLSESKLKEAIRDIIFKLDQFTDEMENSEKRNSAIQQLRDFLGWRQIFIPTILIGWIIDTEVATIRKIQQYTNSQQRSTMQLITLLELKQLALQSKSALQSMAQNNNRKVKLYLHWSAGHYGQFFDDYHINIDQDGKVYLTTNDLGKIKSHTYNRNAGAIGIALACCYGATPDHWGNEPPTPMQIECMSQVVAVLCQVLDLTVNIYSVLTHAEAANNLDGLTPNYEKNGYPDGKYGPGFSFERWDLWYFPSIPKGEGGNTLRGKAIWYQHNGLEI